MPSNELSLLAFLYFIQGLPYGFQAKFLPILLRTEGVSLTNVGLFKFLLAPWLCKALWAPLVDKYRTKRHWLLYSITGLIFTCWFGIFIQPNYLVLLSILLFCLNLCAATQDIAVDSIAVSVLSVQQLGYGLKQFQYMTKLRRLSGLPCILTSCPVWASQNIFIVITDGNLIAT